MNYYHTYDTEQIRAKVITLGLNGRYEIEALTIEELAAVYNGTGPEFLPDTIRAKLDKIAKPFLPAVMVHDLDFERSDGSVQAFNEANDRLLENCVRCAIDARPWYSWRRYVLFVEAIAIYRACCKFGWAAWLSAFRKNQESQEKLNA